MAIEIDGEVHRGNKQYNEFRDKTLDSAGIETLRIKSSEVEYNIESVINKIKKS